MSLGSGRTRPSSPSTTTARRPALLATAVDVRHLRPEDWPEVSRIFGEGISTGNATFETEVPSWQEWDAAHLAPVRRRGRWTRARVDRARAGLLAQVLRGRRRGERVCGRGRPRQGPGYRASGRARGKLRARRHLDAPDGRLPGERAEPRALAALRLPDGRHAGANRTAARCLERRGSAGTTK